MNMDLYPRRSPGRTILLVVGWLLLVGLGIWLVWYGFTWTEKGEQPETTPPPAMVSGTPPQAAIGPTATSPQSPLATTIPTPTDMPLPTATLEPTPIPPTAISTPYVVAGADGVNVREGPDITYTRLGYLDPGAQAEVTGRDGDWWQILYNETPGWVFGELVTAYNAEQIEPPPATPTTQAEPPSTSIETWPTDVFQLINSARAEHGLPPYTYNETLEL